MSYSLQSPQTVEFSVHGVLLARILEWVAIFLSRGSSQPKDRTCISRGSFTTETPGKPLVNYVGLSSDHHSSNHTINKIRNPNLFLHSRGYHYNFNLSTKINNKKQNIEWLGSFKISLICFSILSTLVSFNIPQSKEYQGRFNINILMWISAV